MEIKIDDLTTTDLQGSGAFDNIMTAMQTRLDREYKAGRLKGPEYAQVYLGTFEASLLNTVQFLLGRQQADKQAEHTAEETKHTTAQIRQTDKQTEKLEHDIDLVDVQTEIGKKDVIKRTAEIALLDQDLLLQIELFKKAVFETQLTEVMVENARKEGIILDKTALKADAEILDIKASTKLKAAELPILVQKLATEKEQTKVVEQNWKKLTEEVKLVVAQTQSEKNKKLLLDQQILLMKKEIEKMTHEINLMAAQVQKMIKEGQLVDAQVKKINAEIPLVNAQITKIKNEGTLIAAQIKKITAEIPLVTAQVAKMAAEGALLTQKKISEEGQTKNITTGVVGAQQGLLNKQKSGFDRDAEQKAAKIYGDVLNTQIVALDGVVAESAGYGDTAAKTASAALIAGLKK